MKNTFLCCFVAACTTLLTHTVRADYLVNPAGGTSVLAGTDDAVIQETLPFTFEFFSANVTSIYISSNGNLNTTGNSGYNNKSLATSFAQIAPYWEDAVVPTTGSGLSFYSRSQS